MPRVENLGTNVTTFCEESDEGSSTFDVCNTCHADLELDPHAFDYKLKPFNGDPEGDDGRGGDVEHPPYNDCMYDCEVCSVPLKDNNA